MSAEGFKGFIAEVLREDGYKDVEVVLSAEERTESDGYCDTCYYEYTVLDIVYLDADGVCERMTVQYSFSEIMQRAS